VIAKRMGGAGYQRLASYVLNVKREHQPIGIDSIGTNNPLPMQCPTRAIRGRADLTRRSGYRTRGARRPRGSYPLADQPGSDRGPGVGWPRSGTALSACASILAAGRLASMPACELPCEGGYRALYEIIPDTSRDETAGKCP
jgi:hypothetical protein